MQNIYQSWTQFNKKQEQKFRGEQADRWLKLVESNNRLWNQQTYPQGEYWKYVKFNQLPNTDLKLSKNPGPIRQMADPDFTLIEISNFSEPARMQAQSFPPGLSITTHLEELDQMQESPLLALFEDNDEVNPFSQSALSFAGLGLVIRVAQSTQLEQPLKLVFDLSQVPVKDLYAVFNVLLICEENSQAEVFFEVRGEKSIGLSNIRIDCLLAKKAKADLFIKETGNEHSHSLFSLNGKMQEKANLRCFDFSLPGKWSRHNLNFDLDGTGAEINLKGAYLNNKDYFCDHHTTINHNHKETVSSEDYRGILSDKARAVFNGKIYIAPNASKSSSNQINKNLMLSKKAEVDTKPELQIYNDDVKAAHGATVGQLDDEQRFYLQSRGYRADQARQVLARAFVFDLIETESELVKDFYSGDLNKVLEQLKEL